MDLAWPQLSRSWALSHVRYAGLDRVVERAFYSLHQTRRVSRAEPNKKPIKKRENKDHKDEFQKLQNQLTLSTQFDTDHSDVSQ